MNGREAGEDVAGLLGPVAVRLAVFRILNCGFWSEDKCHILRNEIELRSLHAGCFDSGDACGWRWRIIVRARTDHALRPGVGELARADVADRVLHPCFVVL